MADTPADRGERLQKVLARAGIASRRASETVITEGRVTVNGEVVTELGTRVDPERDAITVDREPVDVRTSHRYLAYHKPAGVLTTADDPHGRPTVMERVPDIPGLFPVGRLDMDTTGLLLLTTDGELGHRLTHPSSHVEKEYLATVEGVPDERALHALAEGVELEDGVTAPAEVSLEERAPDSAARSGGRAGAGARDVSVVRLVIHEGRKRQVRRMLESVGHPVVALHRVRVGSIELGGLGEGEVRELEPPEVARLRQNGAGPD